MLFLRRLTRLSPRSGIWRWKRTRERGRRCPDDLKPQRKLARDAATAFRVPVVEVDGYEADDVCGTLAEIGRHKGYDVLIVTGDGDALQLVDDGSPLEGLGTVKTMITVKGVTDTVVYDEAAVKARYGLTPAQIPDFKGIKGDASDNLPGVAGIGGKRRIQAAERLWDAGKLIVPCGRAAGIKSKAH